MLLENKTLLVTGSSQGIGLAIAKFCLAQGAKVMLHGSKERELSSLLECSDNAAYIAADLAQAHVEDLLISATVERFGRIDGLVNNAGVYPRSTIDDSDELFDQVMAVNAKAPLNLTKAAVKQFRQQNSAGSIVNIGSINAHCGQPDLLIYSMSKGALMTMTRNLADALSHESIRINQLNVGWTATENEIALKKQEGLGENWQSRIPDTYAPRGSLLRPEEIAPHVAFWLSDLSSPCSGAVYEVEQYPVIGRNRICDIRL